MIRLATVADAPAIAAVHVGTWRTTYRGIVPDAILDGFDIDQRARVWAERLANNGPDAPSFTYFAEDSGQVVGFTLGGPERNADPVYTGELYALYILQLYQRRGYGRALTLAVARHLARHGHVKMLIWVLKENHNARRFYEQLGGVYLREQPIDFNGVIVPESAYGYDIPALIEVLERKK